MTTPPSPTPLVCVETIWANLSMAQEKTGALSMKDCREIKRCYELLKELISADEPGSTTKEAKDAHTFLTRCLDALQSRAAFNMNGSIMLLDHLDIVEEWLKEHKNAAMKLHDRVAEKREERSSSSKP